MPSMTLMMSAILRDEALTSPMAATAWFTTEPLCCACSLVVWLKDAASSMLAALCSAASVMRCMALEALCSSELPCSVR